MSLHHIKIIAFDADDTLWDCQTHFDVIEQKYLQLIHEFGDNSQIADELFAIEKANMPILGYGSKAFTISMLEEALHVSNGRVSSAVIQQIIQLGKSLLQMPAQPLPYVESTLKTLADSHRYQMILFTKGEIAEQTNKLKRSGLTRYFEEVEITGDKTEEAYRRLCRIYDADPKELVMIGNSFKSDIAPALAIGSYAIHIPYHINWKMEEAEEFDHKNLVKIARFDEILPFFL